MGVQLSSRTLKKIKSFLKKIKLSKRTFYIIIVIDNNKGHQVVLTVDKVEKLLRQAGSPRHPDESI